MTVSFIPVVSSNVAKIGYDADTETLYVEFAKSGLYRYDHVPPPMYLAFMRADSYGKFLNQSIKPDFMATKIEPDTLTPRILVAMDGGMIHVLGATINCNVIVLNKDEHEMDGIPLIAITSAELDRLVRLEQNVFPPEEA